DRISALRLVGLTRSATTAAPGTNSCSSSSRFGPSSTDKLTTPVRLPPGLFRLATSPTATGSVAVSKTIGIVVVAALAANDEAASDAAITVTRRRTRSAASADN